MCTSVTINTKDDHHFLARNFDFYELPAPYEVTVLPRKYRWLNKQDNRTITSRYAVVGMGAQADDQFGLFDGFNEKGLMGVTHYLEGFAQFETQRRRDKINLAALDFILFVLTQFQSTDEIVRYLGELNLMERDLELTGGPPPIHWIFTDSAKKTIVIESTKDGVKVYDNKVGAFANSPDFRWHLINLNQYATLSSIQPSQEVIWGDYPLVQSPELLSGNFGIPGDYTSPSRFVRAAFLRNHIEEAESAQDGLRNCIRTLDYCSVAKGADIEDGDASYTLYTSAMCAKTGYYYYYTYSNNQLNAVNLFHEDLSGQEKITFPVNIKQSIHYQNPREREEEKHKDEYDE
ncbi:choloylglycine hydrolase family protein [Shouchella sp. 1P09AA]|uniref:choloylglycine hydrolase family protein n=1 Tax=unclassified Shouchella TaxID=2893065 RepID=UPI00399F70A4